MELAEDVPDNECPACGGKMRMTKQCDICGATVLISDWKWHRDRHFEGINYKR